MEKQPYDRQWWCVYFDVPCVPGDGPQQVVRMKRNRITGRCFVFTRPAHDRRYRWNEAGYGWGVWKPLSELATATKGPALVERTA